MLSEKLNQLAKQAGIAAQCKFGTVCGSLDDTSRNALISATKNTGIPVKRISNALEEEGVLIGTTTLREARLCLTGAKSPCRCGFTSGS